MRLSWAGILCAIVGGYAPAYLDMTTMMSRWASHRTRRGLLLGLVCLLLCTGAAGNHARSGDGLCLGAMVTITYAPTGSSGSFAGRVVRVGIDPFALAVDGQTRRVFVVNNGSSYGRHAHQGSVSVLDAATGSMRPTIPLGLLTKAGSGGTPLTPQSIAVDERSGRVFVISAGVLDAVTSAPLGRGWVNVLDGVTGRVLNRSTVGVAPAAIAVDAASGRVFVVNNGDATMSVLDGATGRVLRTVAVGTPYPQAAAIDTRTGHVFVASAGGERAGRKQARQRQRHPFRCTYGSASAGRDRRGRPTDRCG